MLKILLKYNKDKLVTILIFSIIIMTIQYFVNGSSKGTIGLLLLLFYQGKEIFKDLKWFLNTKFSRKKIIDFIFISKIINIVFLCFCFVIFSYILKIKTDYYDLFYSLTAYNYIILSIFIFRLGGHNDKNILKNSIFVAILIAIKITSLFFYKYMLTINIILMLFAEISSYIMCRKYIEKYDFN